MEGTHAVGRQPFMPDSTLSRRSAALHARLAKYPSGNHKIIPRIQILARDAIWSALNLPTLKYWYSYVPRDVLRFLVNLTGSPQLILVTGPFVYPVAAIGISFCVALAAGVGKKRIHAI